MSFSNNQTKKTLQTGDTFGDLALIQKNNRSATISCIEEGVLFCLEGALYRDIVKRLNNSFLKERIYFLTLIPLFSNYFLKLEGLNQIQIQQIASNMIECEFNEGHEILKEGDKGESLFIIKEGTVSCVKEEKEVRKLYKNDYFGESSILFDTKRTLSIRSNGRTVCFKITKTILIDTLGVNFTFTLLSAITRNAFLKSEFLHYFILDECFANIFGSFNLRFYANNETVIDARHHLNRKIIIILEGNLINVNQD